MLLLDRIAAPVLYFVYSLLVGMYVAICWVLVVRFAGHPGSVCEGGLSLSARRARIQVEIPDIAQISVRQKTTQLEQLHAEGFELRKGHKMYHVREQQTQTCA